MKLYIKGNKKISFQISLVIKTHVALYGLKCIYKKGWKKCIKVVLESGHQIHGYFGLHSLYHCYLEVQVEDRYKCSTILIKLTYELFVGYCSLLITSSLDSFTMFLVNSKVSHILERDHK